MKQIPLIGLLIISFAFSSQAQSKHTISGYVKEAGSKEALLGVTIFTSNGEHGVISNDFGFYSLTLPDGDYEVTYDYVGYTQVTKKVHLDSNIRLDVFLASIDNNLGTTVVNLKKRERESEKVQMSTVEIPIKQIKEIPALLGEKDVLKVIQLMPGVQSGSEGQSGLYVRGGGPDQNLIILDGATVYNAQHLFGFFSLFNGDALRSVELIKGGFPARYGGRLSSVIDMNMKDGNKEKTTGELGIGLISSRGVLEGPINKGKGSYIISGRRTYIDVLAQPFIKMQQRNNPGNNTTTGGYYFYDLNAKVNYELGDKDKVYLSGYFGRDKFYLNEKYAFEEQSFNSKTNFGWGNGTGTLRWNHIMNPKLFVNTSLIYSQYNLDIANKEGQNDTTNFELKYGSGIRDYAVKHDYDWYPNTRNKVKFGFAATHHTFTPSALVLLDDFDSTNINNKTEYTGVETGIYIEDEIKITSKLKTLSGIRFSGFHVGDQNYFNFEPRVSLAYKASKNLSVKASYATMNQYVHLLSNSGVGLPTDLWVPATERVKPQSSTQYALGLAKDFVKQNFSVTVEGYYKTMDNIIAYKEGASFLQVGESLAGDGESTKKVTWEDNITSGRGTSYGTEFLLQRKEGKLTGWVGYTLSWTKHKFDSLNLGKEFYARYDRRHDISVVAQYQLKKNITLSATWVYGTGNAITLPISTYRLDEFPPRGSQFDYWTQGQEYTDRNAFRMAAYHRADIGVQFKKEKKRGTRTIEVSAYNLYNQKNPYYYFIGNKDRFNPESEKVLKQVSLFPILPSISWNYKFK
jgi:hypothetical protein